MEKVPLMAIAWPDCSFKEEPSYANSCADAHICSLDVQDADRIFENFAASSLGLQLDEWLTEDPIGSMEEMDYARLFPAMLEHDSCGSFPSPMDNESADASDTMAWGSEDMDLNLIDISSVFQGKGDKEAVENLADSFGSSSAITSHTVSITKLAGLPPDNWKNIIVKKAILDKAVDRLGGGKNGALQLWKLIQVWLKHQKPRKGMSGSEITDCQESSLDTSTSGQQDMPEDLPRLPSNADVCFQNGLLTKSPSNPKADVTAPLFEGISGFNASCVGSTVSEQSNVSVESSPLPSGAKMKGVVEVDHQPSVEAEDAAAARHKLAFLLNHGTREGWKSHASTMQMDRQEHARGGIMQATSMEMASASMPMTGAGVSEAGMSMRSCTTAASTRAARKNRMARKRRSLLNHHVVPRLGRTSCSPSQSLSSHVAYSNSIKCHQSMDIGTGQSAKAPKSEKNVRVTHLLPKELKPSDVGHIGRTDLPKKQSESYPPNQRAKDGITISPKDINSGYKFWLQQKLNNGGTGTVGYCRSRPSKGQMHLPEITGDFVNTCFLVKDHTMLSNDFTISENDVIWGKKVFQTDSSNPAFLKTPISEYAPRSEGSFKEAVRKENSSSSIKSGTVGFLFSEAGKTRNSFTAKRKNLETSIIDEVSKALESAVGTNAPESSGSVQSQLDYLMEDMLEEFEIKLPVVERFPSLDAAAIAQFDEILGLHNANAAAAASECSSNFTQSLAARSND